MSVTTASGVELLGPVEGRFSEILTPEALGFVASLQRRFGPTRDELLRRRIVRQARLDAGELPEFLPETREVREGDWTIAPVPDDLRDRRVEITGPTDRKMVINALNSGARMFMADFEDSLSPTWRNVVEGQVNLVDAIERTIDFQEADGKAYRLNEEVATLLVRPRGWHLPEKHVLVDREPVSGSLFDFGLYFFHNARRLLEKGTGPYFYLPKLESHVEARLWNDVFAHAEEALEVPPGTIKATVLIETILAAFEMDEILFELREHSAGLNAGRWDYMFSIIKKFRHRPEFVLPDRNAVTMTVPFMRAYAELLVKTCHRRGAHAMGGMAAFVPSRKNPEINEAALAKVREDKEREAADGFDGTWVAHPDTVSTAMEELDKALGERPNQIDRRRDDVDVAARDLLAVEATPGEVTEEGLRNDVSVGIQYLSHWLLGSGAAAIFNLMEDTATAEIARSQVWQWLRHGVRLQEGSQVTPKLVRATIGEELDKIRDDVGEKVFSKSRPDDARALFEQVALGDELVEFLTLPAYDYLD
jgi:malate synthase